MKYIKSIISLTFIMSVSSCLTVTQNRIPTSYDTMALFKGYYIREGDPYTGKGYAQERYSTPQIHSGQGYVIQYGDEMILPLRKNEVIRRIIILPKKQGDIRVPRSYIMMVVKGADWVE